MKIQKILGLVLCLLPAISVSVRAETVTLEQVIKDVCTKSDSAKMMKETLVKSEQIVRERRSAAFPTISVSGLAGRAYGSASGNSSSSGLGGGIGFSEGPGLNLGKAASVQELTPEEQQQVGGIIGSTMSSLFQPKEVSLYGASAQVSQPLFTFGKVGTAIQVAKAFRSAAQSSHGRNMQQLQLMALDAYYGVMLSQIQLDIAQRSLARKRELSDFLNRNFQLGSGSKAQMLAAKADLESQVPAKIKAQQDLLSATMFLKVLTGRSLEDDLVLDTTTCIPGLLSMPIPSEKEAVDSAQKLRGDLMSLQYLALANKGGAKIFRSMYLPSIGATASLDVGGTTPEDMGDWEKRNWMVGVGLQWTLFDGFLNSARARQYRSDARKLDIAQQAISKVIAIEVATSRLECAAADSNLAASQQMLAAARESYELTNDNFKQGSGQFTDLQLAEERLRQAELGIVNARYRQMRSRAALQVTMGHDIIKLEEQ